MVKPYAREFYVPTPSRFTLFFRTCVAWQILRFIVINLKMIRMISIGHSGRTVPKSTSARFAPTPPVASGGGRGP